MQGLPKKLSAFAWFLLSIYCINFSSIIQFFLGATVVPVVFPPLLLSEPINFGFKIGSIAGFSLIFSMGATRVAERSCVHGVLS